MMEMSDLHTLLSLADRRPSSSGCSPDEGVESAEELEMTFSGAVDESEKAADHYVSPDDAPMASYMNTMRVSTRRKREVDAGRESVSIKAKYRISRYRRLKIEVFHFLEGPKTGISRLYHHCVVIFILVSMGFAIAMTVKSNTPEVKRQLRIILFVVELSLMVIFTAEYMLRVWSCSSHGTYADCRGKLKYIVLPHMILDVLIAASSLVLIITLNVEVELDVWRFFALLQLLRILRIDRQRGAFKTFRMVVKNHANELITCWYMGFIVVMFLSYLIYADPSTSTNDSNATVPDMVNGVYWGIVSMTTIGYGDISPNTNIAKLLLCTFALVGAGFIAMPAGIIGSGFALQVIDQQKKKHVTKRRRPAAELIQVTWRIHACDLSRSFPATWLPHMRVRRNLGSTIGKEHLDDGAGQSANNVAANHDASTTQKFAKEKLLKIGLIVNKMKFLEEDDESEVEYRELSKIEKVAIGFIRRLKFNVALRNFRQSQRPCDEHDIIDKFTAAQVDILDKIHQLETKMEATDREAEKSKAKLQDTIEMVEIQIQHVSRSMDSIRLLLEDSGHLRCDDV